MGARAEAWQVRAMILGAQASTSLQVGPRQILERICAESPALGEDLADANANLESLMTLWNQLVEDHDRNRVHLSEVPRLEHPTREQLDALAVRRAEEVIWFLRGLDAAGQDPEAFGPEGLRLLRGLAQGSNFLDSARKLLRRTEEAELGKARAQIDDITQVIERILGNLLTVGQEIRGEMLDAISREPAAGDARPEAPKVGRNALCPCGSGRKWKQCCGAPTALH
jgi:hypothetical protein